MSRKKSRTFEQQMRVDQQNQYDEFHTEQIKLKLNRKTDADVLTWLRNKQYWNSGTSMQGEIKRLIREEIAREESERCRCTPTEKLEDISDPQDTDSKQNQHLCDPDVKEYLLKYPDITREEKDALEDWLKEGYSYLDNRYFMADEYGRTMDFIQGERNFLDWQEALKEIELP